MKSDRNSTSHRKRPDPLHPATRPAGRRRPEPLVHVILRLGTAAGLAADAVFPALLAPGYQSAAPEGIGEGNLFLIEAAAAAAAALYVLVRPGKPAYTAALII